MLGGLLRDKGSGWGGLNCGGSSGDDARGGGGRTELARLMLDRALLVAPLHVRFTDVRVTNVDYNIYNNLIL